jgi:hypothetical protein
MRVRCGCDAESDAGWKFFRFGDWLWVHALASHLSHTHPSTPRQGKAGKGSDSGLIGPPRLCPLYHHLHHPHTHLHHTHHTHIHTPALLRASTYAHHYNTRHTHTHGSRHHVRAVAQA